MLYHSPGLNGTGQVDLAPEGSCARGNSKLPSGHPRVLREIACQKPAPSPMSRISKISGVHYSISGAVSYRKFTLLCTCK